jgi:hypothetical protein
MSKPIETPLATARLKKPESTGVALGFGAAVAAFGQKLPGEGHLNGYFLRPDCGTGEGVEGFRWGRHAGGVHRSRRLRQIHELIPNSHSYRGRVISSLSLAAPGPGRRV